MRFARTLGASIALAAVIAATPLSMAVARTKNFTAQGYTLPADKAVTVLLMRPDVDVGELQAGGVTEPNADWTAAARTHLAAALEKNQRARGVELRLLDEQAGDSAQLVADYEALHRAVADAIVTYKFYGAKLPTKKERFDWTLGPGAQRLGELSGANYALFLFTRDNFASDARKAMQVAGALGCLVGFCVLTTGGQHVAYASLVELSTGNVVWFNVLRGSDGDVREADGAQSMIDSIMATMPAKPGESGGGGTDAAARRK